jgi:hypothetical protein
MVINSARCVAGEAVLLDGQSKLKTVVKNTALKSLFGVLLLNSFP